MPFWKDLKPVRNILLIQRTGRILKMDFALLKWPYLHWAIVDNSVLGLFVKGITLTEINCITLAKSIKMIAKMVSKAKSLVGRGSKNSENYLWTDPNQIIFQSFLLRGCSVGCFSRLSFIFLRKEIVSSIIQLLSVCVTLSFLSEVSSRIWLRATPT